MYTLPPEIARLLGLISLPMICFGVICFLANRRFRNWGGWRVTSVGRHTNSQCGQPYHRKRYLRTWHGWASARDGSHLPRHEQDAAKMSISSWEREECDEIFWRSAHRWKRARTLSESQPQDSWLQKVQHITRNRKAKIPDEEEASMPQSTTGSASSSEAEAEPRMSGALRSTDSSSNPTILMIDTQGYPEFDQDTLSSTYTTPLSTTTSSNTPSPFETPPQHSPHRQTSSNLSSSHFFTPRAHRSSTHPSGDESTAPMMSYDPHFAHSLGRRLESVAHPIHLDPFYCSQNPAHHQSSGISGRRPSPAIGWSNITDAYATTYIPRTAAHTPTSTFTHHPHPHPLPKARWYTSHRHVSAPAPHSPWDSPAMSTDAPEVTTRALTTPEAAFLSTLDRKLHWLRYELSPGFRGPGDNPAENFRPQLANVVSRATESGKRLRASPPKNTNKKRRAPERKLTSDGLTAAMSAASEELDAVDGWRADVNRVRAAQGRDERQQVDGEEYAEREEAESLPRVLRAVGRRLQEGGIETAAFVLRRPPAGGMGGPGRS